MLFPKTSLNRKTAVLSVTLFELNRTIWQGSIAFFWFILPGVTFLVTSYIFLSWNKENLSLNHTYAYRMCGIDPYSMLLNYLLTKLSMNQIFSHTNFTGPSFMLKASNQPYRDFRSCVEHVDHEKLINTIGRHGILDIFMDVSHILEWPFV